MQQNLTVTAASGTFDPHDWPVGPFIVERLLGRGGMGEVWRGRHAPSGAPVALKVVTKRRAREAAYQASFRREVRAMAALYHPNVCAIHDHGSIDPRAAETSGGRLIEGSPWLAMELAHGSAEPLRGRLDWPALRRLVLEVLDALAHAHARGLVHRDIKPANILLVDGSARLADFGITHHSESATEELIASQGTPAFMAPEQIAGEWRDFGPPTDLCALAYTVWALATGGPPARKGRGDFRPARPMPQALEGWLARLLEEAPRGRYPTAAAARRALLELPELPMIAARSLAVSPGEASTLDGTSAEVGGGSTLLVSGGWAPTGETPLGPAAEAQTSPVVGAALDATATLPPTWRATQERRATRLSGVGLGLYGLRHVPLVGRGDLRDALWTELRAVVHGGGLRGVLLRGEAGVGKSRLAGWLGHQALELGAAELLKVTHERGGGSADGLIAALQRHLRAAGLTRPAVAKRLDHVLGPLPARALGALTELIHPLARDELPQGVPRVELKTPADRRGAMIEALALLARDRPLLLWLDDLQWADDSLDVAEALLSGAGEVPILLLATIRDDALADLPSIAARLETLACAPRARALSVDPLSGSQRVALVEELLGLSGGLAVAVAERTGGNPLFTTQLVGDWVERGVLVVGAGGFVLAEGAAVPIPDAIHDLWVGRVGRALEGQDQDARPALEIAALLGVEVDLEEWRAACQTAGLAPALDALDRLLGLGLAHPRPGGWAFTHGMLAESLVRLAEEAGRLRAARRSVGMSLLKTGEQRREQDQWRVALRAFARAAPMLDASSEARTWVRARLGWIGTAVSLSDWAEVPAQIEGALEVCRAHDLRHEEALLLIASARMAHFQGRSTDALNALEIARERAGDAPDPKVTAGLHSELVALLRSRGRPAEAVEHGRLALAQYRQIGDRRGECVVLSRLGFALVDLGAEAEGRAAFETGLATAARHGYIESQAIFQASLGSIIGLEGRLPEAEAYLLAAIATFRELQHRRAEGEALGNLGAVYSGSGRVELAEVAFEQALVVHREIGNYAAEGHTQLLFGMMLVVEGRAAEAVPRLSAAREVLDAVHVPHRRDMAAAYLWVARAMFGEITSARFALAELRDRWGPGSLLVPHVHVLLCAARVEMCAGQWGAAREHLDHALQAATAAGYRPESHVAAPIMRCRQQIEAAERAAREGAS